MPAAAEPGHIPSAPTCSAATSSPACSTACASICRSASSPPIVPMIYGVLLGAVSGYIGGTLRCGGDAHPRCRHGLSVPGADHRHHRDPRAGRAQHLRRRLPGGLDHVCAAGAGGDARRARPRTTSWRRGCWAFGQRRIVFRHALPNIINSSIVFSMSDFVLNILLVSGSQLPRPRRRAAGAGMGRDDRRGQGLHPPGLVDLRPCRRSPSC